MLNVTDLKKNFGAVQAVKGISFEVEEGEVLGFLGPNGAGKSTTMRMITGFLPPTGGTASICGHDICSAPVAAKNCFGYLPENAPVTNTRRPQPPQRTSTAATLTGFTLSAPTTRIT